MGHTLLLTPEAFLHLCPVSCSGQNIHKRLVNIYVQESGWPGSCVCNGDEHGGPRCHGLGRPGGHETKREGKRGGLPERKGTGGPSGVGLLHPGPSGGWLASLNKPSQELPSLAPVPGKGHPWSPGECSRDRDPSVGANGLPEVKSRGLAERKLSLGWPPPRGSQACLLSIGGACVGPPEAPRP